MASPNDINQQQPGVNPNAVPDQTQQQNQAQQPNGENIMQRVNQQTQQEAKPDVALDKLHIDAPQTDNTQQKNISFGQSGLIGKRRKPVSYLQVFSISFFVTVVAGIIAVGLYAYNQYLTRLETGEVPVVYQSYLDDVREYQKLADEYVNISNYESYDQLSLTSPQALSHLQIIITADRIGYTTKKTLLQTQVDSLAQTMVSKQQRIESLKQEVTKYGFFSQELFNILENEQNVISMQRSLLSLEAIKFMSAIRVFSYLDTFLTSVADQLDMSETEVQEKMNALIARGEKDVYVYLQNCYLNPYEINYACDFIGDFDTYYTSIINDPTLDREFFTQLMQIIDRKLEQTDIPSFSIVFQSFDPSKKEISFRIDVNTFQQDEIELAKRGITNPHIFVVTNLVNLLKQSKFIVGESIDVRNLKIQPKVVRIGSKLFNVNNSVMEFTLPIQRVTEREIFDFTENTK